MTANTTVFNATEPQSFDEAYYLAAYPDVAEAVAQGTLPSGKAHFDLHGRAERRIPSAAYEAWLLTLPDDERQRRVGTVWSEEGGADPGWYWLAHPVVRARINALASGDPGRDAYDRLVDLLRARGIDTPIPRAVSLGCGFGALERDLHARGIVREIDAYDIAPGAIAEARRLAAGLPGLRYHVADLEQVDLPTGTLDVVFAHSSVHHVARLEPLFDAVAAALQPNGLFHVHEFVGPTRFQWTDTQVALVNHWLDRLTPRLRALPNGRPRPPQGRATVAQMIAADPSESVRSAEILPLLRRRFDIVEERPLGGALLHLALGGIAQNFTDDAADTAALQALFDAEDAAMATGAVGSDFAVVAAARRADEPAWAEDPIAPDDTMFDGRRGHYREVGESALRAIEHALRGRTPRAILDLPCGYGRVTRVLRRRWPAARIAVCDIDRRGVDWTAARFGARPITSTPDLRRLRLPGRYDLVWVGSLITHLSAAQTEGLLRALARTLTPRGVIVATTHGPGIAPGLAGWGYGLQPADAVAVMDAFAAGGYGHRPYDGAGEYGISLTDQDWVAHAAGRNGLRLLGYHPQGWDGHQDVAVFDRATPWRRPRMRPAAGDPAARRRLQATCDPRMRLFDAGWYLAAYPDVAADIASGACPNAWAHFVRSGRAEGRGWRAPSARPTRPPPGVRFDEAFYLAANPDVAASVARGDELSAFDHWLRWGEAEGRLPYPRDAAIDPGD